MPRPSKKLVLLLVIVVLVLLTWYAPQSESDRLFDKVWVDRIAQKPRSFTKLLYFDPDGYGVQGLSSAYRFTLDLMQFDHRGPFRVLLLQDDVEEEWTVKTWQCREGEAPDPDFVHCMSVERNGETTRYFAVEEDEDDARRRLRGLLSLDRL